MAKVFQANVFQNQLSGSVGQKVFQIDPALEPGGAGHLYKQIHHRSGKHPQTAQSAVPQLYMKIG